MIAKILTKLVLVWTLIWVNMPPCSYGSYSGPEVSPILKEKEFTSEKYQNIILFDVF